MDIIKKAEDGKLTVAISGRLDTFTAPQLEEALEGALEGVKELEFDLRDLEYISSAGLRVLLSNHKKMEAAEGSFAVSNLNEMVKEVFGLTGFDEILTIR